MPNDISSEELLDSLNTSSGINRTLGISFILFLFYILVSVFSTTDLIIFLPKSEINLPIVDLTLPLRAYYILAPSLILAFHFNLLTNLQKHTDKLLLWHNHVVQVPSRNLVVHPFLFNYANHPSSFIGKWLLVIIIKLSIFILPIALLVFIQIRFADYHSLAITSFHFILVLFDFWLVTEFSESIERAMQFNWSSTIRLRLIKNLDYTLRATLLGISIFFFIIFCVLMSGKLPYHFFENNKKLVPYLNLSGKQLIKYEPEDKMMDISLKESDKKKLADKLDDIKIKFSKGYNLVGRDLTFVDLSNCVLTNVRLDLAHMTNANLTNAQLQGASLIGTNLEGSNLQSTKLKKANLLLTNLKGANLYLTNLEYSYLAKVDMSGAYIRRSRFISTNLEEASLIGSSIIKVDFARANLRAANFLGAHIENVNFNGAHLIHVDFTASQIENTLFESMDLESTKFLSTVFVGNTSFAFSFFKKTDFFKAKGSPDFFKYTNYPISKEGELIFQTPQSNFNKLFDLTESLFGAKINEYKYNVHTPAGEGSRARSFEKRMKDAYQHNLNKQKDGVLLLDIPPYQKIASLNRIRISAVSNELKIQSMISKKLYDTKNNYTIQECDFIYNYFFRTNPALINNIRKKISEILIFKQKCESAAEKYPSLVKVRE